MIFTKQTSEAPCGKFTRRRRRHRRPGPQGIFAEPCDLSAEAIRAKGEAKNAILSCHSAPEDPPCGSLLRPEAFRARDCEGREPQGFLAKKGNSAYSKAGIDIDAKMTALRAVKKMVKKIVVPGQICEIGSFGGMFASPGANMALIASTDGVGTKLKVAVMSGRHDTVGQDIVNHCVNDILVHGAEPLFFLDYFAMARFDARIFKAVVKGICRACRANRCALLGGETAEMPGLYPRGEYDLVGTIVGAVERNKIITGKNIRPGDVMIGLPSSGLHTNGYSLARKIIFEQAKLKLNDILPGTGKRVMDVLLAVHRSYLNPIRILKKGVVIRGMAHITGGGFTDNVPRVLPSDVDAVFDLSAWTPPPLFRFLQERGGVSREEAYRVFNMGIGLVVILRQAECDSAMKLLRRTGVRALKIGRIEKGRGIVRLIS